MTNARRSVISITAIAALTLAAVASLLLISGSFAEGQDRAPTQGMATAADQLADIRPPQTCGGSGQGNCSTGKIHVINNWSGRTGADATEIRGLRAAGTPADDDTASTVRYNIDASSQVAIPLTYVGENGTVYASVVNEDDTQMGADQAQNAIINGADEITVVVEDADQIRTDEITLTAAMSNVGMSPGVTGLEIVTGSGNLSGSHTFVLPAGTTLNGEVAVPIVGGSTAVRVFNGDTDITNQVVVSLVEAANGNTQVSINFFSIGVPRSALRVTWPAASGASYAVVEVRTNAIQSSERIYLLLEEQRRGSGIFFGSVRLISANSDVNQQVYANQRLESSTANTTVVEAPPANNATRYTRVYGGNATNNGRNQALILTGENDVVTFTYRDKTGTSGTGNNVSDTTTDRSAAVTVETTAPAITISGPEHESFTDNKRPTFSGTVTDTGGSGLDVSETRLVLTNPTTGDNGTLPAYRITTDINTRVGGLSADNADGRRMTAGAYSRLGYFTTDLMANAFAFTNFGVTDANAVGARVLTGQISATQGLYATGSGFRDGAQSIAWSYRPGSGANQLANAIPTAMLQNEVNFQVFAFDLAGNVALSDGDPDSDGDDEEDFRDNFQPSLLTLDGQPPALVDPDEPAEGLSFSTIEFDDSDVRITGYTQTGILWDVGDQEFVTARNAVAVVFNGPVASPAPENFALTFSTTGSQDPVTVENVVVPNFDNIDAATFRTTSGGVTTNNHDLSDAQITNLVGGDRPLMARIVFLVLSGEVNSEETPMVAVTGIADPAGNSIAANAQETARDGLGPNIMVTISGGTGVGDADSDTGPESLTKDNILIGIQANEAAQGRPQVVSFRADNGSRVSSGSARNTGTNRWERRHSGGSGIVCVQVTVTDQAGNTTTTGNVPGDSSSTASGDNTLREDCNERNGATTFTVDATAPSLDTARLDLNRQNQVEVFTQRPRIQIPFDGPVQREGLEITLDGDELELTDMNLSDSNSTVYIYTTSEDLDFGVHTIVASATDFAGNSGNVTLELSVQERTDFELTLNSGWSLISFPSDPLNGAIGSVFSDENITAVSTFDSGNFRAGNQMTTRNAVSGAFSGDLSQITAGLAYWVFSRSVADIEVRLTGPASDTADAVPAPTVLPTIPGYNFVGAVDPTRVNTQGNPASLGRNVDAYLAGTGFTRVLSYNTLSGRFDDVARTDNVMSGTGYLVYINPDAAGRTPSIIP